MNQREDEEFVAGYLSQFGLTSERFTKQEKEHFGKTPDWKVCRGENIAFYCEVKTVRVDTWFDDKLKNAVPGVIVGGERNDPTYNRLTKDIHTAFKQFDSVNAEHNCPNVLAFVNHEKHAGAVDLYSVLTGNFPADSGIDYHIFGKFSEGRIRDEKKTIDLYLWLDFFNPKNQWHFSRQHEAHFEELCRLLSTEPRSVSSVPAAVK